MLEWLIEQIVGQFAGSGGVIGVIVGVVLLLLQIPKSERDGWGRQGKEFYQKIVDAWMSVTTAYNLAKADGALGQATVEGFWVAIIELVKVVGFAVIFIVFLILPMTFRVKQWWRKRKQPAGA